MAAIWSAASVGTGESTVTAMTARPSALLRDTAIEAMLTPELPKDRTDAADHAGHVQVPEDPDVRRQLDLDVLVERRHQAGAGRRADGGARDADVTGSERDAVGVVTLLTRRGLGDLDAALLGQVRGVDKVRRLGRVPAEGPDEGGGGEQTRPVVRERTLDDDLERRHLTAGQRTLQLPELTGERDERAHGLHPLRADGRDVDRGRHDPSGQRRHDLLGHIDTGAVLRLDRRGAQVGRHDDTRHAEQRALGGGLLGKHVHGGAGQVTADDGLRQCGGVDQVAARDVDDARAGLHLGDRRGVDHAAGLGCGGHVERDEVALGVEVVDLLRTARCRVPCNGLRR